MTGFMELTPGQQLSFDKMKRIIENEYASFGFTPIDTPVLERSEVLLAKAGGETEKQVYRFLKGNTDISMRFDLTVPLARYVAEHYNEIVFPFRRSQIGKVYRGERPQRGRFREFYQCDIDVIGEESLSLIYDAEMPKVIYAIFSKLNLGSFTIKINNRKILMGLMQHLEVEAQSLEILRVIDKIDKISAGEFNNELQKLGLKPGVVEIIGQFVKQRGLPEEVIKALRSMGVSNELFNQGINELEEVTRLTRTLNLPYGLLVVDTSIARGLDYYTGTVYETTLNDYSQLGSVCSGGRYENLASLYSKRRLPGVGISIGLTRLFSQLTELNLIPENRKTVADTLILPLSANEISLAAQLADSLRANDFKVDTYLGGGPIKKMFKFADRLGINTVLIIGSDEAASGKVTVQNMQTGQKTIVGMGEIDLMRDLCYN